jgi:hypothetical protein
MKLSEETKNKIDQFFENHSEEEVKLAFQKLGLEFEEEKPKDDDDLSIEDALNNLYNDIYSKGEYLHDYTYSEFDHCFEFARRLKKLINRIYG